MPTARPIMTASVNVKFGMSNAYVKSPMIPTLVPRPINALTIGIPAAMIEPNVMSKIMKAAMIPTISEVPPTSVFIDI